MADFSISRLRQNISQVSLIVFSALIFGYLWWGRFHYLHRGIQILVYGTAAGLIVGNHVVHRDSLRCLGLRFDNAIRAAVPYGGLTLPICLGIILSGLSFGSFEMPASITILTYLLWATIQQHVLQNFLRRRSEEAIGHHRLSWLPFSPTTRGILLASILFALYHLPNPVLVTFSLFGALFWCFLFTRIPSLPWAILSQTLLTITLLTFFKHSLLGQFEVGAGGYRYDYYGNGTKVAAGYNSNGAPRIVTLPGADLGRKALLRVFDTNGVKIDEWVVFGDLEFSGEVAVGDLGYRPGDEIVVAAGPGGGNPPLIRVFDFQGQVLAGFFPDGIHNGYGAWVSVACGKILVTPGPAPQAPQTVLEFGRDGKLTRTWDFQELGLVNSLRASAICDEQSNEVSRLVLWGTDIAINPSTIFLFDVKSERLESFETIKTTFGAQVTLLRWEGGLPVIGVAPGPLRGYPPLIGIYDLDGTEILRFAPETDVDNHGANLAALDIDGDGQDELIVGEGVGPARPFTVRVFGFDERGPQAQWQAYP